jgi:hypothetical protein
MTQTLYCIRCGTFGRCKKHHTDKVMAAWEKACELVIKTGGGLKL